MNEPINGKSGKDEKIRIDHDQLNATLNSWLMPGTTGTLIDSRQKKSKNEKEKAPLVIYLGDGNKSESGKTG
jgi:hypothetical protein